MEKLFQKQQAIPTLYLQETTLYSAAGFNAQQHTNYLLNNNLQDEIYETVFPIPWLMDEPYYLRRGLCIAANCLEELLNKLPDNFAFNKTLLLIFIPGENRKSWINQDFWRECLNYFFKENENLFNKIHYIISDVKSTSIECLRVVQNLVDTQEIENIILGGYDQLFDFNELPFFINCQPKKHREYRVGEAAGFIWLSTVAHKDKLKVNFFAEGTSIDTILSNQIRKIKSEEIDISHVLLPYDNQSEQICAWHHIYRDYFIENAYINKKKEVVPPKPMAIEIIKTLNGIGEVGIAQLLVQLAVAAELYQKQEGISFFSYELNPDHTKGGFMLLCHAT